MTYNKINSNGQFMHFTNQAYQFRNFTTIQMNFEIFPVNPENIYSTKAQWERSLKKCSLMILFLKALKNKVSKERSH